MKQGGNKKVNMMRSDVRSIPRFVFASSEVPQKLYFMLQNFEKPLSLEN
jgi:hypothetical protein